MIIFPWYTLQLFSEAKSFRLNPIIGNKVLNFLGLHLLRVLISHSIMNIRMMLLSFGVPRELRKEYYQNGYILVKNILDSEAFTSLESDVKNISDEVRECKQGNTITQRIHLNSDIIANYQGVENFLNKKNILNLLKFMSGKNRRPIAHIQLIKNNTTASKHDPQKTLHSDTFHPTMKYWLSLHDVNHNMAPFMYVKGSHKLTLKRLLFEYKKSVSIDKEKTNYAKNGSFRFDQKDLDYLGLPPADEVCISKNTLVIVNTFGIHRRGDTDKKVNRLEVFGISRTNPFNIFVGFDFSFLRSFDNWKLQKFREYHDEKALKKGKKASWSVSESKTLEN